MTRELTPPRAEKRPLRKSLHGQEWEDEYHWLRDRTDPAVLAYLEAENRYTARQLAPTEELQSTLYREMRERIQETDLSVPARKGPYEYYQRTEEGLQYPIFCRRRLKPAGREEILLDLNELADDADYLKLGAFRISPDHQLLAYSLDLLGNEDFTIHFKDLASGELLSDAISGAYYSMEWANDSQTLFYNLIDQSHRPFQLRRHTLGTEASDDVIIYSERDESFFLSVSKTRDDGYLLLNLENNNTSEVRFLPADTPDAPFQIIEPRRSGVEYEVDHRLGEFFVLTNDDALNFKVVRAPVQSPTRSSWAEFLPHDPAIKLDHLLTFRDHLALFQRKGGFRQVMIYSFSNESFNPVDFGESVCTVQPGLNPEFETPFVRVVFSSMVTPDSVYDCNLKSRKLTLRKRVEVLGGYDPGRYATRRIEAVAEDGVRIPISLLHRSDLVLDGNHPLLLYGYGAYGICVEPAFSSNRFSLVDRGVIFAIAHVRGGEELGRGWYNDGKLLRKKNTFEDFIRCAETLVDGGYTRPQRLAILGGSAGGLLIGSVINTRPDLFQAAVAKVPFVDVLNTMLDPTLPLTVIEFQEWGNPADPAYFEYIESYSPYDNVSNQAYPDLLVTAGLNDPRVSYWEPAKWTARLRAKKRGASRLLLKTNLEAGHGGASGRYDQLKEIALEYAFILNSLQAAP